MILYQFNTLCNFCNVLESLNLHHVSHNKVKVKAIVISDLIIDSGDKIVSREIRRKYNDQLSI